MPDDPQRRTELDTIYRTLFNLPEETAQEQCERLGAALCRFDPQIGGTEADAIAELRALNGGQDPAVDLNQLLLLKEVSAKSRPMSPVNEEATGALAARRFWRSAVFGPVSTFKRFSDLIHAYAHAREQGPAVAEREAVIAHLASMAPEHTWTQAHLDDLVILTATHQKYEPLQWWNDVGDTW